MSGSASRSCMTYRPSSRTSSPATASFGTSGPSARRKWSGDPASACAVLVPEGFRATKSADSNRRDSAAQNIVLRPIFQLAEVLAAPRDHLAEPFFPADLRLPSQVALDGAGVEPIAGILPKSVGRHLAQLLEGHAERLGAQLDHAPDAGRLSRARIVDFPNGAFLGHQMYGSREIARVNVRLLCSSTALQGTLRPGQAANDRLRNDAMKQLTRTIGVRRADHVHRELQKLVY